MGSPESEQGRFSDERQHEVTITKEFEMAETQVTQALWREVMGTDPSRFKGDLRPVEQVSWDKVQEFIAKLNAKSDGFTYRLPTEAEWEYACRAGTDGPHNAGAVDESGWYWGNSNSETHDVAQKKPNEWGLYDMHGNVWEWCQDWYGKYSDNEVTDPSGPLTRSYRVIRGGSWVDYAQYLRSAYRNYALPGYRNDYVGFRLCRERKECIQKNKREVSQSESAKRAEALRQIRVIRKKLSKLEEFLKCPRRS